ncbi:MAG: hypothetical protein IKM46_03465 [Clostridia bacterium]|nr:hypothetical protein [Clostridia bacterium]
MNCLCNLFNSDDFIWFVILAILIVSCGNCGCGNRGYGSGNGCGCGC